MVDDLDIPERLRLSLPQVSQLLLQASSGSHPNEAEPRL